VSITIAGYSRMEVIQEGANILLYRAWRKLEQSSVLIKTLKADYPTLAELTQLKHEYEILQSLNIEGIVKPLALSNYSNGLALILSDLGGESLKQFITTQNLNLQEFLQIAIQMAATLAALHENHIIHQDIQLQNFLLNPKTGRIQIIDLSMASRLSMQDRTVSYPDLLAGTLAYI